MYKCINLVLFLLKCNSRTSETSDLQIHEKKRTGVTTEGVKGIMTKLCGGASKAQKLKTSFQINFENLNFCGQN